MSMLNQIRHWARAIQRDVVALWIAARDPRTPFAAKIAAGAVAAYALSPIDLIPDFIPVLGYLDDLVIVPAGILLAARLIQPDLMAEFRTESAKRARRPTSHWGAAFILGIWLLTAAVIGWILWPRMFS